MSCPECGYSGLVVEVDENDSLMIRADMLGICYNEDKHKKYAHKLVNEEGAPDMIYKSNNGRIII